MLGRVEPVVELGDPEVLEAQARAAPVAGEQRQPGREPAAGAPAVDRDPGGVDAELVGVVVQPHQRGVAVLDPGRERVLGRQPVLDRDHDHARARAPARPTPCARCRCCRRRTRRRGCRGWPAPAPAPRRCGRRPVDTHGDLGRALGPGDAAVVDVEARRVDVGVHRVEVVARQLPRRLRVVGGGFTATAANSASSGSNV